MLGCVVVSWLQVRWSSCRVCKVGDVDLGDLSFDHIYVVYSTLQATLQLMNPIFQAYALESSSGHLKSSSKLRGAPLEMFPHFSRRRRVLKTAEAARLLVMTT